MRALLLAAALALALPAHADEQLDRIERQIERSNDLRAEANYLHNCWLLVVVAIHTDDWLPVLRECTAKGRESS